MILRAYEKSDPDIICKWISSETQLYQWSADRFNKYPLAGKDIRDNYEPQIKSGRFFPLTAVNEKNEAVGHFIIRYPSENDDTSVRFGFVIIDPLLRGKGLGKQMLRLGIEYARKDLGAKRIDLGVFENNESARSCYGSVGFREYGRREVKLPAGIRICIDMELFIGQL